MKRSTKDASNGLFHGKKGSPEKTGYDQNTCKKLSLQFGMVVSGTGLGCKGWGLSGYDNDSFILGP